VAGFSRHKIVFCVLFMPESRALHSCVDEYYNAWLLNYLIPF